MTEKKTKLYFKCFVLLCILHLLPGFTWAQTTAIPFARAGNLIILSGEIGGQTGNFILDTGAPYLVLNQTYFDGQKSSDIAVGLTTSTAVSTIKVDTLAISGHKWQNLKADVVDLASIENAKGIKILGLMGVALFIDYELTINYSLSQLYLTMLDKNGNRLSEKGFPPTKFLFSEKLKIINNHLITEIGIGKKKLKTCIDTGAEACVLDNNQPTEVWNSLEIIGRFILTGVGNTQTEVLQAKIDALTIGNQSLNNVRSIVTNLDNLSEAYGVKVDFILGYTLLSGYIITFNFAKETVTFSTNA